MKERPIIFNGPMVRAILEGKKTQTRRVMDLRRAVYDPADIIGGQHEALMLERCPYGKPGDRLWVRETFGVIKIYSPGVVYKAESDNAKAQGFGGVVPADLVDDRWKPSIHMPRWASRITLEITNVRVERLQDISKGDVIAEGLIKLPASGRYVIQKGEQYAGLASNDPREVFARLWESIKGPGSWNANPWVWVIEFKKLEETK